MKNKELRELIYKYNRTTLPEGGINDKMMLKLEKLFTSQQEDIKRKIERKRIKEETYCKEQGCGCFSFNRALEDILKIL